VHLDVYTKVAVIAQFFNRGSPSAVECVALPIIMTGVNLDITSMDLKGTAISAAHAALISYDTLKEGNKVVVLAATADFLSDVESEINEVSNGFDQYPVVACVGPDTVPDPNAEIILSLSSEVSKLSSAHIQMIIVCETNTIIRFIFGLLIIFRNLEV
jgi:hypothetical protein